VSLALGIADPEAWLDETPREVIDGWEAYFCVEPWGMSWHQNALTCTMLDQILGSVLAYLGAKHEPEGYQQFMPVNYVGRTGSKQKSRRKQTPEMMLAMVESVFKPR